MQYTENNLPGWLGKIGLKLILSSKPWLHRSEQEGDKPKRDLLLSSVWFEPVQILIAESGVDLDRTNVGLNN